MNKQLQPSNNWTSDIQDKRLKEEFVKRLLESKDLFQRLYELTEVMREDNHRSRVDKYSYEKPAWSEYQADCNGFERCIDQIQNYLKFAKEK